ncbi:MAG: hypothetical protein ACI4ET_12635 [Bilifractor sp.]
MSTAIYIALLVLETISVLGMLGGKDADTRKYAGQLSLFILIAITIIRVTQICVSAALM